MLLKMVPGHKDIPGNEMADKYAKEAATISPANSSEGVEEKIVLQCHMRCYTGSQGAFQ